MTAPVRKNCKHKITCFLKAVMHRCGVANETFEEVNDKRQFIDPWVKRLLLSLFLLHCAPNASVLFGNFISTGITANHNESCDLIIFFTRHPENTKSWAPKCPNGVFLALSYLSQISERVVFKTPKS